MIPKITFNTPAAEKDYGIEIEASAKGKTSLILSGKRGVTNKGIYLDLGISFGGMTVYVTGKAQAKTPLGNFEAGIEDMPYQLLEPIPDTIKGRKYFIENN